MKSTIAYGTETKPVLNYLDFLAANNSLKNSLYSNANYTESLGLGRNFVFLTGTTNLQNTIPNLSDKTLIYIQKGDYIISPPIIIDSKSFGIVGMGLNNTILKGEANQNIITINNPNSNNDWNKISEMQFQNAKFSIETLSSGTNQPKIYLSRCSLTSGINGIGLGGDAILFNNVISNNSECGIFVNSKGSNRNIYFYNNVIDNCNIGLRFNNSVSVSGYISNNMFNKNDEALASVDQSATQYSRSGIIFSYNGQYPAAINSSTGLTISNNHNVEEATYITGSFFEISNPNYLDGGIYIDDYETMFNDLGDASNGYGTIVNWTGFWGGRQAYYSTSIAAPSRLSITPVSPISGNEVWSGDVNITSTTTINTGASVTIIPRTVIATPSGASLIVNGILNSVGTSSQPITFTSQSGTTNSSWGTITLSGSGAAGSIIKYANVKYGTKVEAINTSNITIQYCNIDTTYDGIRFNNSTGSILNNTITTNSIGHGIVIENASTATVNDNVIKKTNTYRCGVGIDFGGGAGGNAARNDIYGWDWGICAIWGSSPTSTCGYSPQYNNRIRNCNSGFTVYRLSYPVFGIPPTSNNMWNSLSGNSYNAKVGMSYTNYASSLVAYGNYWGGYPPDAAKFQVGPSANIYYSYALTSDPWSGMYKIAADDGKGLTEENKINQPSTEDIDLLLYGIELRQQNKYSEAKDYFISYIKNNPDKQAAYVVLYNCYSKETADEIIKFFSSLPAKASKDHKLLLAYLYLKNGDYKNAKEVNNSIIAENPNTDLATKANLNNVYIALYNEENINEAIKIFNDALSKSKLSTTIELSQVHNAIETYGKTYGKEINGLAALPNFESSEQDLLKQEGLNKIGVPDKYQLLGNYPNPFNPSTTISYALPYQSSVEIIIYDLMGKEIKSFTVPSQSAGYNRLVWDGRNESGNPVTSGVYFYRISIKSLENNETFIKTAKMLMLK